MKRGLCALLVLAPILSIARAGASTIQSLQAAGDELVARQNADGGWGFPLTGPSLNNMLTATGIGLARAYQVTGSSNHLTGLQKAGSYLLSRNNDFTALDG